jgi:hypothetical protein
MHTFTDCKDRPWTVDLTVATLKRVREATGVNLYSLVDDGARALGELVGDPERLVGVLYVLCEPQVKERSLSPEDFGSGFRGDALEQAADAFVAELVDFFPNRRARDALAKVIGKGRETAAILMDRLEAQIHGIDPSSVAEKLSASSGASPDRSALTPAPAPSAS